MKFYYLFTFLLFIACNESPKSDSAGWESTEQSPYYKLHVVFEGEPDEDAIRDLVEGLMEKYNVVDSDEEILNIGNAAYVLKESSAVGVTEMDILKHAYQHGISGIELGEALGRSAAILEKYK